MTSITFGNGRTWTRSCDVKGRIRSFTLAAQSMAVGNDAASRITSIKDAANAASGSTFAYDLFDRRTNVRAPGSSQTYAYDAVDNRTQKVNGAAQTSYTYGERSNRLTHVGNVPVPTDPNGSITEKPNATFKYDVRGRMVSAQTAIGLVTYTSTALASGCARSRRRKRLCFITTPEAS